MSKYVQVSSNYKNFINGSVSTIDLNKSRNFNYQEKWFPQVFDIYGQKRLIITNGSFISIINVHNDSEEGLYFQHPKLKNDFILFRNKNERNSDDLNFFKSVYNVAIQFIDLSSIQSSKKKYSHNPKLNTPKSAFDFNIPIILKYNENIVSANAGIYNYDNKLIDFDEEKDISISLGYLKLVSKIPHGIYLNREDGNIKQSKVVFYNQDASIYFGLMQVLLSPGL